MTVASDADASGSAADSAKVHCFAALMQYSLHLLYLPPLVCAEESNSLRSGNHTIRQVAISICGLWFLRLPLMFKAATHAGQHTAGRACKR